VRARIVLLSGRGFGRMAIARETRVSKPTVWRWQEAYMEGGVERLRKDRGKGPKAGKPRISDAVRLRIVTMTAKEKPAHATHWSARMWQPDLPGPAGASATPAVSYTTSLGHDPG
jgi:transposase